MYFKNSKVHCIDKINENENYVFDSLDLLVNNTNYQPEYLKKLYVIDFYKILKRLEKKLKNK